MPTSDGSCSLLGLVSAPSRTDGHNGAKPDLCVERLGYSLRGLGILQDVTAQWCAGAAHAILGPSGAGKTTLLRCAMGDIGGKVRGSICFGGLPMSSESLRRMSAFIPQDDTMPTALSPRDLFRFSARLRGLPASVVDELILALSLQTCADTRVGDATYRGISGGERKRCSIGLELLSRPHALFADEPTTGLDSATASDVASLLVKLASSCGCVVVATLHQPSWTLLSKFATVTLLAGGRTAYHGSVQSLLSHFVSNGWAPNEHENPADYFMYLLQDVASRDTICDVWGRQQTVGRDLAGNGSSTDISVTFGSDTRQCEPMPGSSPERKFACGTREQAAILIQRGFLELVKDRTRLISTVIMKSIVGIFVGAIWWGTAKPNNRSIFLTESSMFVCIFACTVDTLVATLLYVPGVKGVVHRECLNSLYSFPAWFVATMITYVVQQWLASLLLALPVYFMSGLRRSVWHFAVFFLDLGALASIGSTLGLVAGGLSKDFESARQAVIPVLVPQIVFSGYLIPYHQLPAWGRWLYHVALFQYGLSIVRVNQFSGIKFEDDCPDVFFEKGLCYQTGSQYLASLRLHNRDIVVDFLVLGSLFIAFASLAYVIMKRVATRASN